MSAREIVRRNLKALRRDLGLSQEQVAQHIRDAGYSMDKTIVSRIESGDRSPLDYVDRYAAAFGLTAESLMRVRADNPSNSPSLESEE